MSDAKYRRLDDRDDDAAQPGCFRRLFRRRPPTTAEKAAEAERKLAKLMLQLPVWMAEADRKAQSNDASARECLRRGNRIKAKTHARAAMAHRRYQVRLGQFHSNVNEARILQSNAKVAGQLQEALGTASQALEQMIESMSYERISQFMDKLQHQREDLDEMEAEMARSIDGGALAEQERDAAEYDPDVQAYLEELLGEDRSEPVQPPVARVVVKPAAAASSSSSQKKKKLVAAT